jgi:hypothetical protein
MSLSQVILHAQNALLLLSLRLDDAPDVKMEVLNGVKENLADFVYFK